MKAKESETLYWTAEYDVERGKRRPRDHWVDRSTLVDKEAKYIKPRIPRGWQLDEKSDLGGFNPAQTSCALEHTWARR